MKKIFTLMAAGLFGVAGMMAMPLRPAEVQQLRPQFTTEGLQKMRAQNFDKLVNGVDSDDAFTRSWTDSQGGTWELMLFNEELPLCDVLTFIDDKGNEKKYTFEELPFYQVSLSLIYYPKNSSSYSRFGQFILAWPCNYYYKQIWEYGTWDIPENEIDWSIVLPSELCNEHGTNMISLFEQTGSMANPDDSTGGFSSWGILPAPLLKIPSQWDGMTMYSQDGSTLDFKALDSADDSIELSTRVNFKQPADEGTRSASLRINYSGQSRLEGFQHLDIDLPNFGDIYLFNTGVTSSEILGDETPFTEAFSEVTQFYTFMGDSNLVITVDEKGAFSPDKVGHQGLKDVPESELDKHANIVYGYLYADAEFGKDTSKDPSIGSFKVFEPTEKIDEKGQKYLAAAPVPNVFMPRGYSDYLWSSEMGLVVVVKNQLELADTDAQLAWGTTTGFHLSYPTIYDKYITAAGPDVKVHYYYDPTDLSKVRIFSAVGTEEWNSVEGVEAENGVQVIARDGMIVVNAAEKAPVAIFTLDGKLVKAVEAENVAVEAAKGVYVVRVGDKAQKVVL